MSLLWTIVYGLAGLEQLKGTNHLIAHASRYRALFPQIILIRAYLATKLVRNSILRYTNTNFADMIFLSPVLLDPWKLSLQMICRHSPAPYTRQQDSQI